MPQLPVVLIHPLAASRSIWLDVIAALPVRRVLTLDVPGHGRNPPSETAWTMGDLADLVAALLDAEGIERAHVAGMSLGGTAALQFALDHPGRVAGIVAADCVPHYPADVASALRARADEVRQRGMSAIGDSVLASWFTDEARAHDLEIVASTRTEFVGTPPNGYAMAVDALIGTDLRARLPEIACPTLLVYGREDLKAMRDAAVSMDAQIPGAHLRWLPGAHAAPVENPSEFATLLADFMTAVESGQLQVD